MINWSSGLTGNRIGQVEPVHSDWSRRPLSEKQLTYALADVTHLRDVVIMR